MHEATFTADPRLAATNPPSPASVPAPEDRQIAALALFCRALDGVNRLERRPVCSAIEYVMQQLRPGFDAMATGHATVEELAALAASRGLVRLATVGGELLVQRKPAGDGTPAEATVQAQTPVPALYREILEEKLKCPLPSAPVRQRVFTETAAILTNREKNESPISLLDLSYRVDGRLGRRVGQRSVFKLLLALVLANAFVIAPHQRLHKIGIYGRLAPVEHWDDLFVDACLVGLRRDRPVWPLPAELLASVLDTSADRLRRLLEGNPSAPAAG